MMSNNNDMCFKGFSPKTFDFLISLQFNNNKQWFEENKPVYMEEVVKPFKDLVKDLSSCMHAIDPAFDTRPEIGKTISRINRDVRFSKDKSPYRSSVWITFKRLAVDWKTDPCFFFEITPEIYRWGMGFYLAERGTMRSLRELIDEDSDYFKQIAALYAGQSLFTLEGEKYKKVLDKSKPEEVLDWYQRKDIYFMCTRKVDKRLFDSNLVKEIMEGFEKLKPFYEFLWHIKLMGQSQAT